MTASCYSLLPSDATSGESYTYQSSGYCKSQCSSYNYFALSKGTTCFCFDSDPSSLDKTDNSSCNVKCNGYSENCGGANAYLIYKVSDYTSPDTAFGTSVTAAASSSSGSSSSSSGSSSSSNSASITNSKTSQQTTYVTMVTEVSTQGGGTHVITITSSSISVATSVVNTTDSPSNSKSRLIGPIVGGVVGGLAALSILALVIFFIRRQKRKDHDLLDADANIIASAKRAENSAALNGGVSHNDGRLTNPFDEGYSSSNAGLFDTGDNRNHHNDAIPGFDGRGVDEDDYYERPHRNQRTLAVVNPDDD